MSIVFMLIMTVLQINFEQTYHSVLEYSTMLSVTLQFNKNQSPFNITLSAVTINQIESMGLDVFIDSSSIVQSQRATAGKVCMCLASVVAQVTGQ